MAESASLAVAATKKSNGAKPLKTEAATGSGIRVTPALKKRMVKLSERGYPVRSIAKRVKLHESTVYYHLSQARKKAGSIAAAGRGQGLGNGKGSSVSAAALVIFRQARKLAYDEVRAGREFSKEELKWLLGYEELISMTP